MDFYSSDDEHSVLDFCESELEELAAEDEVSSIRFPVGSFLDSTLEVATSRTKNSYIKPIEFHRNSIRLL